jgi:protease-4
MLVEMFVLRFLGFVLRLVLLPLMAVWIFLRRRLPRNAWLQVNIEGSVTEFSPRRSTLFPFLPWIQGQRGLALTSFHELVDRVAEEPRVRGVAIVIRSLGAGMATSTSLRKAIERLRATGREVVVYLPNGGDTRELYVASAANRVLATPHATIAPVGFVSSSRYAKRALDKLGIGAERLAAGAYKSAGETFSLDKMSDGQREQLGAVLDTFYEELVDAIAQGRKVDRDRAKALVDGAPYSSERAVENGLLDGVAYEDELSKVLGDAHLVSADRFLASRRRRLLPELRRKPVLAVLPLHGAITSGSGPFAMDDRFIAAVRAARSNRRVHGVLLHIDSPGGGALASDKIHHELVQLAREKPVVAYFGNVAASGGYYAAAAAHHIVAEPTTITGSIGVVAARVIVEPLLQKLGIVTETLQRGAHATLLDPLHPVSEDERAVLETEIQGFYDGFLNVVATGRKRSRDEVHAVAQGRVWSGRDAKEKGLVDELGDGRAALAALKSRVPNSQAMKLVSIRAPLQPKAPLPPAAMLLASLFGFDGTAVYLAFSRERVLAYSVLPTLL